MPDDPTPRRLLEWGLAGFHTTFFFAVAVTLLHLAGALGSLLSNFSTLLGLGLFGVLALTTFFSTRRGLRGLPALLAGPIPLRGALGRALLWGGVNGVLFFAALGGCCSQA